MLPPICLWCKYYKKHQNPKEKDVCDAFPDEIPYEIWRNAVIHQNPYERDNGIQFEKEENYEELPRVLKIIVERSPLSSDEILSWIIAELEKINQQTGRISDDKDEDDSTL